MAIVTLNRVEAAPANDWSAIEQFTSEVDALTAQLIADTQPHDLDADEAGMKHRLIENILSQEVELKPRTLARMAMRPVR